MALTLENIFFLSLQISEEDILNILANILGLYYVIAEAGDKHK